MNRTYFEALKTFQCSGHGSCSLFLSLSEMYTRQVLRLLLNARFKMPDISIQNDDKLKKWQSGGADA